ncbi:MAG: prepilin-type N-terminal cleavage/methylation domain-containing protein [Geobacter sp.]|nr:prepilin-type N-terminal cleavage/methylation domain-containing protein [Geobacter sp.]
MHAPQLSMKRQWALRLPMPKDRPLLAAHGFTLIELVVVLAILALVTLLVIPRLPDSQGTALKGSARALATTLRYLQDQVATTRQLYRLRLTPGTGEIRVAVVSSDGTESDPRDPFFSGPILREGVTITDVQTPRLGTVSSGVVTMDIGPAGLAEVATIHLRGGNGGQMTVVALSYGGRVTVGEGYLEANL